MNRNLLLAAACLSIGLSASAADGLASCRAISDAQRRLACYDALTDAAVAPAPLAQPSKAAAVTTAAKTGEAAFGLPEARRPDAVESVDSTLPATFSGWGPNSRIRLDNGQVWQVVDGSSVVMPAGARNVRVTRGLFGSFQLDIEGLKTSPKVRRVD